MHQYFAAMYFKVTMRYNPELKTSCGYYRLVESYRNIEDRVCHRTILNVGFVGHLTPERLNKIQKALTNRAEGKESLFEEQDALVQEHIEKYWSEIVSRKRIDLPGQNKAKRNKLVDVDTIKHKDVREIGSEWLSYQALEQLGVKGFLENSGWEEEQIQLALTK